MCPVKALPWQPRGGGNIPVSSCPRHAAWTALLSPTCVLLVASSLCPFLLRQASFHASRTSSFSTQNRTSTARPCGERCHGRQLFTAS